MDHKTINEMIKYCNKGNPSSGYLSAKSCRDMMNNFSKYLLNLCSVDDSYRVIFTSGASEANCMIIRGIIDTYSDIIGRPHIITSNIEHKSVLLMIQSLEERDLIDVTYINAELSGHITPQKVADSIRGNTALICIMAANNETGAVNNISRIAEIAHTNGIIFHSDTVQIFGKAPINLSTNTADSICVSFHKFGGPPGVGALIVREQLLAGYKIQPLIFGTQGGGLRGGTENIPAIGAAYVASINNFTNRAAKNKFTLGLKKVIIGAIKKIFPSRDYIDYVQPRNFEIVFLSGLEIGGATPTHGIVRPVTPNYLCNTILLSVVKTGAPICNIKIKDALEAKGIIISVGSACNTSSPKASHVLYSMGCDEYIRRGALRISLGDNNTLDDCKAFLREFVSAVKAQL